MHSPLVLYGNSLILTSLEDHLGLFQILTELKDEWNFFYNQHKLTWRDRIVRTNRTAATTRYFSLLCVTNKTLSMTLLRRKLHLQMTKTQTLKCHRSAAEIHLWKLKKNPRCYFILYGWWRTQKQSNSHMFDSISGFATFWSIDWALPSKGHDAVITSINWPRCFS